jgi:hypothetical protein
MLDYGKSRSSGVLNAAGGIIFLGTPHFTSNVASWQLTLQRIILSADYTVVPPNFTEARQELQGIAMAFHSHRLPPQLQIYTFIETDSVSYSCYISLQPS